MTNPLLGVVLGCVASNIAVAQFDEADADVKREVVEAIFPAAYAASAKPGDACREILGRLGEVRDEELRRIALADALNFALASREAALVKAVLRATANPASAWPAAAFERVIDRHGEPGSVRDLDVLVFCADAAGSMGRSELTKSAVAKARAVLDGFPGAGGEHEGAEHVAGEHEAGEDDPREGTEGDGAVDHIAAVRAHLDAILSDSDFVADLMREPSPASDADENRRVGLRLLLIDGRPEAAFRTLEKCDDETLRELARHEIEVIESMHRIGSIRVRLGELAPGWCKLAASTAQRVLRRRFAELAKVHAATSLQYSRIKTQEEAVAKVWQKRAQQLLDADRSIDRSLAGLAGAATSAPVTEESTEESAPRAADFPWSKGDELKGRRKTAGGSPLARLTATVTSADSDEIELAVVETYFSNGVERAWTWRFEREEAEDDDEFAYGVVSMVAAEAGVEPRQDFAGVLTLDEDGRMRGVVKFRENPDKPKVGRFHIEFKLGK